jgi:hypothetical protein
VSRKLRSFLFLFLSLSTFAGQSSAQSLIYIGEGVRQNTTVYTFDSYKMEHYASSAERMLSPQIERSLHLTMLTDFGTFFTKAKMVEALEQALHANTAEGELSRLSSEIGRFKKTLLSLPIKNGTELRFNHSPESGLQILMNSARGLVTVFQSEDQNFSMNILSIWLGQAHPDANNRESLVRLIEALWKNAR